jgi:hypothetical protein
MSEGIVMVRCMTVASEPVAPVPSTVERCYKCGTDVWLSLETAEHAATLVADEPSVEGVKLVCEHCPPPAMDAESTFEAVLPAGQIDRLREDGFSNSAIAHLAALMMVAEGESPEATWKEIRTNPRGELARRYVDANASAAQQLLIRQARN